MTQKQCDLIARMRQLPHPGCRLHYMTLDYQGGRYVLLYGKERSSTTELFKTLEAATGRARDVLDAHGEVRR